MNPIKQAWELYIQGGPLMWPILAASLVALTVAVERFWALRRPKVIPATLRHSLRGLIRGARIDDAIDLCSRTPSSLSRITQAGLEWWDQGPEAVRESIEDAGRRETPRLLRGLGVIGTVASISPLMGLLGTVTGMIRVFHTISLTGPGQGESLSAGIAEALLTTAFGLVVAIPSLVLYNLLRSRAESLVGEIEDACREILRQSAVEDQPEDESKQVATAG